MGRTAALLLLQLLAPSGAAEALGEPPPVLPPLAAEVLEGPVHELTWETLRGAPAVVELFATWCGPCWGELERWDALSRRWSDEEMKFVLLGNEPRALLQERLLDHWSLDSWVATDRGQLFDTFSRCGLPLVLLVDGAGALEAAVHPRKIDEAALERHAAGLPSGLDVCEIARAAPKPTAEQGYFRVAPTAMARGSYSHEISARRLRVEGLPLAAILPLVYDLSPHRLVVRAELPDHRLDLMVRGPEAALRSLAQQGVERSFRLASWEDERELPVYVLRAMPDRGAKRVSASPTGGLRSFGPGRIGPARITGAELADALEAILDRPVVDETGEREPFAAETVWRGEKARVDRRLRDTLGLELVPAHRTLRVRVVDEQESRMNDAEEPAAPGTRP